MSTTVIRVQSEQSGSTAAYRGLRDPIRALLGIERGEQAAMAAQLRDAVADRAPPPAADAAPARRRRPRRRRRRRQRSTASMSGSVRPAPVTPSSSCSTRSLTDPWSWSSTTRNGWTAPPPNCVERVASAVLRRARGCSSPPAGPEATGPSCRRRADRTGSALTRATRARWSSPPPRRRRCARTSST